MKLFEFEDDRFCLVTEHDFQGMDFVWYSSPVNHYDIRECYARIATFDQLEYYAEVFLYLNPDVGLNLLTGIFQWLANRENGKTVRTYGKHRVSEMIDKVFHERVTPWCRRMRRVIFNPDIIISSEEKMSITAQVIRKGLTYTQQDLLETIKYMSSVRMVATQTTIANEMSCSVRTVQRLINRNHKKIIKTNNERIKRENKIEKVVEWIDVLTSEGNTLKMRHLKDMTNIRDYSILKEAIYRYENLL